MLNEKEWKRLEAIKERSSFESCAGYSGLSIEEARWLISLLERTQSEAESIRGHKGILRTIARES